MFLVRPISLGSTVIGFLIQGSPVDPTGQLHRYLITLLFGGMGTLVIALVGLEPTPDRGRGWIRVQDDGPGIPHEDLPHVFGRFYQVDRARSQEIADQNPDTRSDSDASGSGLGLSIVQWIARAHGGDVCLTSELGVGTTFEVRLPLIADGPR